MHRHLVPKLVGAVVLLVALGGGVASAFTASNNVGPSYAGEGVNVVSGYNVSQIHYTLSDDPTFTPVPGHVGVNIAGVSFTLDNSATTAGYALFDSNNQNVGGGSCTSTDGYHWTCTAYPAVNNNGGGWAPLGQVTQLDVMAAS